MDSPPLPPHWQFSLEVYGQAGVAEACLALQDRLQVRVNVLLLALYATQQCGRAITEDEIAQAHGLSAPWHEAVVVPLRMLRQRLKTWPEGAGDTGGFRERIKAAELEAERHEQQLLAPWLDTLEQSHRSLHDAVAGRATLHHVLEFYAAQRGSAARLQDFETIVACLAQASAEVTGRARSRR